MIVSASRRTDIPAFYTPWLFNRLREGYVLVPSPYDPARISRVRLTRDAVDCFVFWTKNPEPMLGRLEELSGYPYYFQFTLNAYDRDVERNLPPLAQRIDTFRRLADRIGPDRVVWRYDPVLINPRYDEAFHTEAFARIARGLEGVAGSCMLGFIDRYPSIRHAMDTLGAGPLPSERIERMAPALLDAARSCGIALETCTVKVDLTARGIRSGMCIDRERVERLAGYPIRAVKDRNQRAVCRCIESIDIGTYATCLHGCAYCYAMRPDHGRAVANRVLHDPASPLLLGQPRPEDTIRERVMYSLRTDQKRLF